MDSEENFKGSGLRHLSSVASLRILQLLCRTLTDDGLSSLPMFTSLDSLHLGGANELTDDALRHVGKLIKLHRLNLHVLPHVTNAGLAHLDDVSELTNFDVTATEGINDDGLRRFFGGHSKLINVAIPNSLKGEARTVKPLVEQPHVRGIGLSPDQLTDEAIAMLNSLPKLENLDVRGSIRDEEARRVAQLTHLKQLVATPGGADHLSLSRVSVQALSALPELESIHIYHNRAPDQFDDACLLDLSAAKKLKRITMGRPRALTDAGIEAFRKSRPDVFLQLGGKDYPATAKPDAAP